MADSSTEGFAPEWLEYEKLLGGRQALSGSAEEIIKQFNTVGAILAAQAPPPDSSIHTHDTKANGIPIRIYTPAAITGEKLPVGVYYHGGGFLLGSLDSEDSWCRTIAKNTPCIIVSVAYRLSTEAKAPAQLDDSLGTYKWVWENAATLGGDQAKVFTIGASAGSALALTVTDQLIKSGNGTQVKGIVTMCPLTAHPNNISPAYSSLYTSYTINGTNVPVITSATMTTFFSAAGIDQNWHDETVFATLSKDLDKFPRTYIATCGKDPIRDDGKVLEVMLKERGREVKSDFYEGMPHTFWMFPGVARGEEFFDNVVSGVRWVLEG